MSDTALYYPHIGFRDPDLLKAMAMFYESVFRIVPDGVIPDDASGLEALLELDSIGVMIDPVPYSAEASSDFLNKASEWNAAALHYSDVEEERFSRLHSDKIDVRVRELFNEMGYEGENAWFNVPTQLASNFMLYLATQIASRNQLELITGDWGAWTGTSYFNLNGEIDEFLVPPGVESGIPDDSLGLFGLLLDELTPINISEIPSNAIAKFREHRRDEMACVRKYVADLKEELSKLDAAEVSEERIRTRARELSKAIEDYKRSADILKVKGWFGVRMLGVPATAFLGKLFAIPDASTIALGTTGLALGGLFNIASTREQLSALRKSSPASAFMDLQRTFKGYTRQRGGGDMNFHAYNCMEEYVND